MNKDKKWMHGSSCGDYSFWTISPLATLINSKRDPLFISLHSLLLFFDDFSVERLARGKNLNQKVGNWLHRHLSYSDQEPSTYEVDLQHLLTVPVWSL